MLKIEHLYKSFQTRQVLNDLNLEVKDGSVFGLVGINGAGKSTLLRLIAGVYQRDSGSILLNGSDTWSEVDIRREIAFAADEAYVPSGSTMKTVRGLYETMYDFDRNLYEEYLREFDLNETMPYSHFSKGMKRRAAMIFALCIHPKLLLLDEAYDGLEPLARLRFKQILARRMEEEQISVIISSHNLRELEDICDTYGILQDGAIAQYGDLLESKERMKKYQIAFDYEIHREMFSGLELLHYRCEGRVAQLVIRGEEEAVTAKLNALKPVLLDVLPVTFEELFLYELEQRGDDHE